jgi:hypothetical protein
MKRLELIEQLEAVQENIEAVENQLASKMPLHYEMFGKERNWKHVIEIRTKALAYWKRRFNRILLTLGYML